MRDVRRMVDTEDIKNIKNKKDAPEDDMDFMQWKEELNRELYSFWKSLTENYQE